MTHSSTKDITCCVCGPSCHKGIPGGRTYGDLHQLIWWDRLGIFELTGKIVQCETSLRLRQVYLVIDTVEN